MERLPLAFLHNLWRWRKCSAGLPSSFSFRPRLGVPEQEEVPQTLLQPGQFGAEFFPVVLARIAFTQQGIMGKVCRFFDALQQLLRSVIGMIVHFEQAVR